MARRGRVKSRNIYKGPMDKDNGEGSRGLKARGRLKVGAGRWAGQGRWKGKMETTVLEQQ